MSKFRWKITDRSVEDRPSTNLPQTQIVGADPASIVRAVDSGDLADLRLSDGTEAYGHHSLVDLFDYSLAPVPTLALVVEGCTPTTRPTRFRFVDVVITDWTTAKDYEPEHPNNELCGFS